MSKVFAIYPLDKSSSTSFLNRIHTFETRMLGDAWHCYKVMMTMNDVFSKLWIVISSFLWVMVVILSFMELVLNMVK